MATHSSTPAWKFPWTEKPGSIKSVGLQRVRHGHKGACNSCPMLQFCPLSVSGSVKRKPAPLHSLRFSFASNRTHSLAQMTSGRRTFIGAQPRRISNKLTMTLYYLIYKLIFNVVVKITFSYVLWVGQKVHSGFCKKLVKSPNKLFDQPIHCKLKNFIKILKKEGNTL